MFYKTCPADFVAKVLCIQILNKFLEDRKKVPPSLSPSLTLSLTSYFSSLGGKRRMCGREGIGPSLMFLQNISFAAELPKFS